MTTYDITADEIAPETLFHCAGCARDVEPHVLMTCEGCHQEVCCASVETLAEGERVLCRRCNDALEVCDHCGKYALSPTKVTSGDPSVGYRETQYVCGECAKRRTKRREECTY